MMRCSRPSRATTLPCRPRRLRLKQLARSSAAPARDGGDETQHQDDDGDCADEGDRADEEEHGAPDEDRGVLRADDEVARALGQASTGLQVQARRRRRLQALEQLGLKMGKANADATVIKHRVLRPGNFIDVVRGCKRHRDRVTSISGSVSLERYALQKARLYAAQHMAANQTRRAAARPRPRRTMTAVVKLNGRSSWSTTSSASVYSSRPTESRILFGTCQHCSERPNLLGIDDTSRTRRLRSSIPESATRAKRLRWNPAKPRRITAARALQADFVPRCIQLELRTTRQAMALGDK